MKIRGFVAIFLAIVILSTALLSTIGVDAEHRGDFIIGPLSYFERVSNVFQNFPDADYLSYSSEWEDSRPEYVDVIPSFPVWNRVEIDGALQIPKAIESFMNNLITYVRHFFVNIGNVFPNLWTNLTESFSHWFSPVRVTLLNVSTWLRTVFTAKDWFVCISLSILPCDWERVQEVDPDFKIPFFGEISNYPLAEYFGG